MNIITYSNRIDKLQYLIESESLFNTNINYVIKQEPWKGNITKIVELAKILDTYNDNDVIIFIDAFDVLINSDKREIVDKFKSYNCDILVGAELNCFPSQFKKKFDEIMPKDLKNKYLNSGGYMGYVKNIKLLLKWMNNNRGDVKSDQHIMNNFFIENYNKVNIKLDTKSLIFQNMHLISWKEIDFRGCRVYNNVLNTYPCFVHFNGGTWQTMEKNNIMPVFVELMKKSKNNNEILNLDKYNQIITRTCYPHPQICTDQINNNLQKFKGIPKNLFDIVIPVGPNDKSVIEQQIKYTQKNVIGYRNIYLICYDPTITIDGCITIHENIFPFNIDTVAEYHGKLDRNGWYLQQLLKLYAGKIIPNILDKYLVIDSDTFFLKPTTFVENNKCLYNYGTEYHEPYFHHMEKLDKDLTKIDKSKSGICHHMIFETKYIDEIITKIENNHNELFYNIFLKTVTNKKESGASEYEIYFNYMLKYNPDKIKIRKLHWRNTHKLEFNSDYDYISYHWFMRR